MVVVKHFPTCFFEAILVFYPLKMVQGHQWVAEAKVGVVLLHLSQGFLRVAVHGTFECVSVICMKQVEAYSGRGDIPGS